MIRFPARDRFRLITALLLITPALSLTAQQPAQQSSRAGDPAAILSDSAIRAIIQQRVDSRGSTGIAVGFIGPDGKSRVFAYGASGTARPIDANSVFEIGSITKTFTTAILADMVAKGEVKLDDPVAKYLPPSVKIPARNGRQITLVDLATQSSGLPGMPTNFKPKDPTNPYADYSEQLAFDFLSSYELTRDIGSKYEYSNLGMGLLGIALSHRAGTSYDELVKRRVLDPLAMADTRITLTPSMRERLALGHDAKGNVVSNWDIAGLTAAGALRSTVNEMLKYLAANMDPKSRPLGPTLAATHTKRHDAGSPNLSLGLAWHILTTPFGGDIVWHNGGTGGYRTFTGFDPVRHVGVVVLTNARVSADDIGFHLIEPRMPLRPPAPPAAERKEIALAPEVLERYVGDYAIAPELHIVVTREGNALYGQPTGQPRVQLFPEKEDEFFLKVIDAQVRFTRDSSGKINGLVLTQDGQSSPGAKVK